MSNRRILFVPCAAVLLLACGNEAPPAPAVRDPIAFRYVAEAEVPLHRSPDPASPVVATFAIGERVSVLAQQPEWAEVRITLDQSGWIRSEQLSENPPVPTLEGRASPTFLEPPSPIFSPSGASGEIVLEAQVNDEGRIVGIRTIRNTTGRADLETRNKEELRSARFYPLLVQGRPTPFVYEHRVSY